MAVHGQALVDGVDPAALGKKIASALGGDWSAAAGLVVVRGSTCELHEWPEGLRLDAYATTEPELKAVESAVSDVVAKEAQSTVHWNTRPSTVPGAPPTEMPVYNFPGEEDDD